MQMCWVCCIVVAERVNVVQHELVASSSLIKLVACRSLFACLLTHHSPCWLIQHYSLHGCHSHCMFTPFKIRGTGDGKRGRARVLGQNIWGSQLWQDMIDNTPFLSFIFQNWLHGFPGLFADTSQLVRFYFLVLSFFHFLVFGCVW